MSNAVAYSLVGLLAMWLFFGVLFIALALSGVVHGPWNYFWFFTILCWFARDIYWIVADGAESAGPVGYRGAIMSFSIYALYCLPLSSVPLLGLRLVPHSLALTSLGASLCVFGVGFSVWARFVLARSWNPCWTAGVPLRESHKLVVGGPYTIVRHPIYFGMLTATFGMVIVLGEARALALPFGMALLLQRIGREEATLRATFPGEYPEYERRVKRLLPGIW
jgi:protein-S-isoprenylcysteine O-methyltransferase Ste14